MEQRKRELSKALKIYIEQIVANAPKYIQEKTALQRFFGLPPSDMNLLKGFSYFYKDPRMKFQTLFFNGMDFHFLEFRILAIFFWYSVALDPYLAVFLSYIIESIFVWFRAILASRNLSLKTMVDQRFLI